MWFYDEQLGKMIKMVSGPSGDNGSGRKFWQYAEDEAGKRYSREVWPYPHPDAWDKDGWQPDLNA